MEDSNYDILIIDDSQYIKRLLTQIIELKGFTCKSVENISLAMQELEYNLPKLIFLDVNLPDSNGYDFCKVIKSVERFKNILIYYFTGISKSDVAVKTLETKADGFLTKPFDLSDFNDIFDHIKSYNFG
ncbi:MAG: PleD family two-component system response regulator [Candidatus Hodarchaeota archaeon]